MMKHFGGFLINLNYLPFVCILKNLSSFNIAFGSFSIQSVNTCLCCLQTAPLVGNSGEYTG